MGCRVKGENGNTLRHFLWGVGLVLGCQVVFMGGGLLLERSMGLPITGVPSLLGLTVVLGVAGFLSTRTSEHLLLGSFTFAILFPLTLYLAMTVEAFTVPVNQRLADFSLGYLCALTLAVWIYFGIRILGGKM